MDFLDVFNTCFKYVSNTFLDVNNGSKTIYKLFEKTCSGCTFVDFFNVFKTCFKCVINTGLDVNNGNDVKLF